MIDGSLQRKFRNFDEFDVALEESDDFLVVILHHVV